VSWSSRLRNIALSQLRAIKERLDRIDAETLEDRLREYQARADAERELADGIGRGGPFGQSPAPTGPASSGQPHRTPPPEAAGPDRSLERYYRILGVRSGAGLAEVEAAYRQLMERCAALDGAEEGTEERQIVAEIRSRVDEAYKALREALNPTAGRFDKLEL